MAINKKLIHFQKLSTFKELLAANNILDTSIVFIKDSQQIWTHGQYYSIADAPADNNSYVRKNNGWVLAPSSGIEIYIGEDLPSSDYTVWIDPSGGYLYYRVEGLWLVLSANSPVDLSLIDVYGKKRASATTANCYMVHKSGMYRIPLVYGNAIVNGSTNSASYTKVSGDHSLDFVNGANTIINTPFIELQVPIKSALLSIADTLNLVSIIKIVSNPSVTSISDCGYILFKVNSAPEGGANGVISIKDASGTIIWNWHIHIVPWELSTTVITNNNGVNYTLLSTKLGLKASDNYKPYPVTWFYQWGRSVPMLCAKNNDDNSEPTSYGKLRFATADAASSYHYGIANPTTFYRSDPTYGNWFSSTLYYNLWDANCTTPGSSDNVTVKTVYDPCPPGFKIPNGNTFTGIGPNGEVWSLGWSDSGVHFPFTGLRNSYGRLEEVGTLGVFWTSAVTLWNSALYLRVFNSGVSTLDHAPGVLGCSVLPVAEL